MRPALLPALVLLLATAQPARAQIHLEVWGGLADGSPRWGVLGEAPDMAFGILALRLARELGEPGGSRVTEFTVDLIPLALLSPPYVSLGTCGGRGLCVLPPPPGGSGFFPAGSATGYGINPAGLTTRFRAQRRFSPAIGVSVGGLWFDREVPTTRSSRFNFTAAIEAGVRVGPPDETGLTFTYRLHHISNAGTAEENPGVASHLFSVGLRRGRRPPA